MSPETMRLVKFIAEWAGSLGLIIAYGLVSLGWCSPKAKLAIVLNLIGSGGFIVLNWLFQSWPAVGVNVIWFAVALFSLVWTRKPTARNNLRLLSNPAAMCAGQPYGGNHDHRCRCQDIPQA